MQPFRALRLAVVSFCVLTAVLVASVFVEGDSVPAVLREWSDSQPIPLFSMVAGVFGILGVIIACAALLAHKKWGAWLHLTSSAVGTAAVALMGAQVSSAATSTLDSLLLILSGFIYGLAFFTDALAPTEKTPNQALQPTALLGRG